MCTICGSHCGYEQARESVKVYTNWYKIKKTIYRRKYLMERRLRPFNVGTEKYTMFVNMFKEIDRFLKGMTVLRFQKYSYLFSKTFREMGEKARAKECMEKVRSHGVCKKYERI